MRKLLLLFSLLTLFGLSSKAYTVEETADSYVLDFSDGKLGDLKGNQVTNGTSFVTMAVANTSYFITPVAIDNVESIEVVCERSAAFAANGKLTIFAGSAQDNMATKAFYESTAVTTKRTETCSANIPSGKNFYKFSISVKGLKIYSVKFNIKADAATTITAPTVNVNDESIEIVKAEADSEYGVLKYAIMDADATEDDVTVWETYSAPIVIADLGKEPGTYQIFAREEAVADGYETSAVTSALFTVVAESLETPVFYWTINGEAIENGKEIEWADGDPLPVLKIETEGVSIDFTKSNWGNRFDVDENGVITPKNVYGMPETITATSNGSDGRYTKGVSASVTLIRVKKTLNVSWKLHGESVEEVECVYGQGTTTATPVLSLPDLGPNAVIKVEVLDEDDNVIDPYLVRNANYNNNSKNVTFEWWAANNRVGVNKIRVTISGSDYYKFVDENGEETSEYVTVLTCKVVPVAIAAPTITSRGSDVYIYPVSTATTVKYYYGEKDSVEAVNGTEWAIWTRPSNEEIEAGELPYIVLEAKEGLNYIYAQAIPDAADAIHIASEWASASYDPRSVEVASVEAFRNLSDDVARVNFSCDLHPFAMLGTTIFATDNTGAGVCITNIPESVTMNYVITGLMADVITLDNGVLALEYQSSDATETSASAQAREFDEFTEIDPAEHVHNYVKFTAHLKDGYLLPAVEVVNPAMYRAALGAEGVKVDDKLSVLDATHEAHNHKVAGYFDYVPAAEEGAEGSYVFVPTSIDNETGVEGVEIASEGVYVAGGSIIAPEGAEIFAVNGAKVAGGNVAAGVYVVRLANGAAVKVLVK